MLRIKRFHYGKIRETAKMAPDTRKLILDQLWQMPKIGEL